MNPRPASQLSYFILTLACIGFFLFAATCFIQSPGFYYDEVLFAPLSYSIAGQHVEASVGIKFLGLPVTTGLLYLGTLKAYLMALILSLFGSSYLTVRLPMILVGAFCVWLLAKFLEPRIGIKAASFAILLAATDPLFIYATKIDWGPTTLAALFRCLAIGFLFRFFETRRSRDMALFLGACVFGLWDKSNFIWVMIALGAASLIFYREALLDWLRATPKKEIATTIFLPTLIYLLMLLRIILPSLKAGLPPDHPFSAMDYIDRIGKIFHLYMFSASGEFILIWAFGAQLAHLALAPWLVPFQTLFGLITSLPNNRFKNTPYRRELGFLSLTILLIFVQAVLTPQTGGAHHMVVFWPLTHVQLILCGLVIGSWIKQKTPFILFRYAFFVFILFLCGTAIRADGEYLAAMRDNKAATCFRPEIADLAARLNSLDVDKIYAVDWGLQFQLLVLSKREDRVKYEGTLLGQPGEAKWREVFLKRLMSKPRAALVSFAEGSTSWPTNHLSRDATLQTLPLCSRERIFIPRTTGEPLYQIDLVEACPTK